MRSPHWPVFCLIAIILLEGRISSSAFEMKMAADILSLHANNTPLRDILLQFQEAGVKVAIDESINPLITSHFENREMREGIKHLLADCDYALTWQTIDGPAGKIRRISEILVYKPGDRHPLQPLPAPPPTAIENRISQTNTIICLKNEILVRLLQGTTKEQFLALLRETETTVLDSIPALGLYRLHFPPGLALADVLSLLAGNPLIAHVEPNQVYRSFAPVKFQNAGTPATLHAVKTETGPAVAILDSGFSPIAALEKTVIASLDATAPGTPISDPLGHGTQMALIAAGAISPEGGNSSLAPQSGSIIPIRTMDEKGITSGFTLMQSMIFAIDQGARVINMSWGSEGDSGFFHDAISYVRQHGAVPIAAAGNEPTDRPLYPAAMPDVLAVAALGPDGTLWDQSNYGSFVKLAAPGFATMPVGYKGPPGTYCGTSIAAAYTARVVARYFSTHPTATASEAINALNQALTHPTNGVSHPEISRLDSTAVSGYLK